MAVVKLVAAIDFQGFQAGEGFAIDSAKAIELVGARLATYSDSGDATANATAVAAYQAAHDKPVTVRATIDPDGHVTFVGDNPASADAVKKFGV